MTQTTTTDPARWNQRYLDDTLPWNTDVPDMHLVAQLDALAPNRGRALDIGCGTGTHSVWLATQGMQVRGVDVASAAIARAQARAQAAGVVVDFAVANIQHEAPGEGPFDLVFDRGCFHVFASDAERDRFAAQVAQVLSPSGYWLSIIGSTEGPERETGPPRRSLRQVADAIEPHLEIVSIRRAPFSATDHEDKAAWVMIARRREARD